MTFTPIRPPTATEPFAASDPEALFEEARAHHRRRRTRLLVAASLVASALAAGIGWVALGTGTAPTTAGSAPAAASASGSRLLLIVDFNTALVAGTGQATREEERAVERVLAASPHVMHLTFVSRQAALAAMKRAEPRLAAALPFNPLPDEYRVTVQKADAQQLERQLASLPGVQKVILGRITRR